MRRREFIALLGSGIASPLTLRAQQAKINRIGFLASAPVGTAQVDHLYGAFVGGLQELGYRVGTNLVIERRFAEGRNERFGSFAKEFVDLAVDLIVAPGTSAALAAQKVTNNIPIVTVVVGDPVGSQLIESLARPGGNITGMSSAAADVMGKALQLLKEATPHISRIAVLWIPTSSLHVAILRELEVAAGSLRVRLQPIGVATPEEIESAVATLARDGADALITLDDPLTSWQSRRIADLALQQRLPTVSTHRLYPETGALMSYGARFDDLFRRAATHVDKILKGAKPADLPVEQPTEFELVINLKTAKALGVTIQPLLLARADEVIE